jgi:carbamoylphosphate synthase large subunit
MDTAFDPVTDLGRTRAALDAAGIAQPPWRECATPDEARAAAEELGLPALVRSLGDETRGTGHDLDAVEELAREAIGASASRPACLVELKRGGGCTRERRAEIDEALGQPVEVKVVAGEVVGVAHVL